MITEKSNRLQVIMITDYDYPNSDIFTGSLESRLIRPVTAALLALVADEDENYL